MVSDIPRGTLCSYVEASSLLSSEAEYLLTVSSLTAALRAPDKGLSVEPVYLDPTKGAGDGDEIFVHNVLLKLDGEIVIQVRSVYRSDNHLRIELSDCGTQPLGEHPFDDTSLLKRSDLESFRFKDADHPPSRQPVAAYRSYLNRNGGTLELTEYFLLKSMDLY